MDCTDFRTANYDVSIDGLGWFSVQGKGFVSIYLNLPYGIKHHVRESPMRPFEIKDKGGLQKYTGMTVGAKTPKNKKLSRKFEL